MLGKRALPPDGAEQKSRDARLVLPPRGVYGFLGIGASGNNRLRTAQWYAPVASARIGRKAGNPSVLSRMMSETESHHAKSEIQLCVPCHIYHGPPVQRLAPRQPPTKSDPAGGCFMQIAHDPVEPLPPSQRGRYWRQTLYCVLRQSARGITIAIGLGIQWISTRSACISPVTRQTVHSRRSSTATAGRNQVEASK